MQVNVSGVTAGVVAVLAVAWIILGISAMIHSMVCSGRTPSMFRATVGIVIAMLFGPFYWLYLLLDHKYCRSIPVFEHYSSATVVAAPL